MRYGFHRPAPVAASAAPVPVALSASAGQWPASLGVSALSFLLSSGSPPSKLAPQLVLGVAFTVQRLQVQIKAQGRDGEQSHRDRKIEDKKMGVPSIFLSSIFRSLCGDKLGESHSREIHRETAKRRANRIIAEELAHRGGRGADDKLLRQRGSWPLKGPATAEPD
jgi:hypothetical protein